MVDEESAEPTNKICKTCERSYEKSCTGCYQCVQAMRSHFAGFIKTPPLLLQEMVTKCGSHKLGGAQIPAPSKSRSCRLCRYLKYLGFHPPSK